MSTVKPMGQTWFVLGILLLIPGIVLATDTRADALWVSKTLARMSVEGGATLCQPGAWHHR